jgi:hypothetical protein
MGQLVRVKAAARARAKRRRVRNRARPAAVSLHSRRSWYRSLRISPRASQRSRISCNSCSPAGSLRRAGIVRAEHRVPSAPRCSAPRTAVSTGPGSSPVAIFESVGPHGTSNRRESRPSFLLRAGRPQGQQRDRDGWCGDKPEACRGPGEASSLCLLAGCKHRGVARLDLFAVAIVQVGASSG